MRTVQVKVYKFDELSEKAKQAVKAEHAGLFGYHFAEDAIASLKKLAEHFGGTVKNYSIDFFDSSPSSARFDMPEMEAGEIESKLSELGSFNPDTLRGNGDCVLTGSCTDEDAIDGLRQAYHAGTRDLNELMQAAFKSWLKQCQADCADQYTDTQFSEFCEANDDEFYADGRLIEAENRKAA